MPGILAIHTPAGQISSLPATARHKTRAIRPLGEPGKAHGRNHPGLRCIFEERP